MDLREGEMIVLHPRDDSFLMRKKDLVGRPLRAGQMGLDLLHDFPGNCIEIARGLFDKTLSCGETKILPEVLRSIPVAFVIALIE